MHAHEPAAGSDKLEQILPPLRFGETGADVVVEKNCVEPIQRLFVELGRVLTDIKRGEAPCPSPAGELFLVPGGYQKRPTR